MDPLLTFLSHEWSGLAIALLIGAIGFGVLRIARRRATRLLAGAAWTILALAVALAGGASYHLWYVGQVRAKYPTPGKLVDVGGYRMHVLAEGDPRGRPAIVWMPGAHSAGYAFHHLHAALRGEARSILIDRPGSGWSDAGPFPRTTPREAEEIVTALAKAGERGPFIFAGHSFGGLLVANIARRHPELVAAVVLIDATPPDAINYCPPNPFLAEMQRDAFVATLQRAFGIHREFAQRLSGKVLPPEFERVTRLVEQQLAPIMPALTAVEDSPRVMAANRSSFEELRRGGLGWDEIVYDGDLEDQRVYLVAPPRMAEFATVAPALLSGKGQQAEQAREQRRLLRFYEATRERYMQTSTRAVRIYAPDGAGHNFPYEDPAFMVATLRRILTEATAP